MTGKSQVIFVVTEADVKSALDDMDVELDASQIEEVSRFVADRFENRAVDDIGDAVCDALDDLGVD